MLLKIKTNSYSMKGKILVALKTKYKTFGFGDKAFDGVADYLSKTVTEESQIETAISGVEGLLKAFQGDIDTVRNEKSFSFVGPTLNLWDEEIESLPFEYSFTAWERWKKMADEGGTILVQEGDNMVEASVSDLIEEGITLNPVCLVYSSIDEDNWENEPSDWIEPKGMFNEKTFSFQFPWDHVNSLGYTQIRVTYTLNE